MTAAWLTIRLLTGVTLRARLPLAVRPLTILPALTLLDLDADRLEADVTRTARDRLELATPDGFAIFRAALFTPTGWDG